MRRAQVALVTIAVVAVVPWSHAEAATPRTVLVEAVTNLGSVGDVEFRRMLDETLGRAGNCEYVVMDAWWPRAKDPLFMAAAGDVRERVREAGIRRLPAILVDGVPLGGVVTAASLREATTRHAAVTSPVTVQVRVATHAEGWHVTVEATGDPRTVPGTLALTTALVEDEVGCPGCEGRSLRGVFRGYLAGRAGQVMQLRCPGAWWWEGDVSPAEEWAAEHTRVLATVRDAVTGEVLQTRSTPLAVTGSAASVQGGDLPRAYALATAGPNPMSGGGGVVSFDLPEDARVELTVYNVEGRRVAALAKGPFEAGRYRVAWAGDDGEGRKVAPGVYFVSLRANEWTGRKKVILSR